MLPKIARKYDSEVVDTTILPDYNTDYFYENGKSKKKKKKDKAHNAKRDIADLLNINKSQKTTGDANMQHHVDNQAPIEKSPQNEKSSAAVKDRVTPYDLAGLLVRNGNFFAEKDGLLFHYKPDRGYYQQQTNKEDVEKLISRLTPEYLRRSLTINMITEVTRCLKSYPHLCHQISDEDIDKLRYRINFTNGCLDILTGERLPQSPLHYFTNYVAADYPFDFKCSGERFLGFIKDVSGGNQEVISLLQECMGLMISEIRHLKKAFYLRGVKDSGKTIFLNVMRDIVGEEFCSDITFQEMDEKFRVAMLCGKKLNSSGETKEATIKNLDTFKKLTGGDPVIGEIKFQSPRPFRNRALLVFAGNHLPQLKNIASNKAFFKRIAIIPFEKTRGNLDHDLPQKLMAERSFIVKFGVEGIRRLIGNRFELTKCQKAEDMLREYMYEQNSFIAFLTDRCELDPCKYTYSEEIGDEYEAYCTSRRTPPITNWHSILKEMPELRHQKQGPANNRRNGYWGINIKK